MPTPPLLSSLATRTLGIEYDRPIITWMVIVHLLALAALPFMSWSNLALFACMHFVTGCLGITFGYHRLIAHRSMKAHKWVERFLATCGVIALQGSPLEWVAHHRMHHSHTDTDDDPHNSRQGFWFSHMGWMMQIEHKFDDERLQRKFARDVAADPYLVWLGRPEIMIGLQVALGLAFWAAFGFGAMLWGIFFRIIFLYHATWFVNSACHMWGYRSFATNELSRNCWWVGLLTWGEGWHNNHHAQQEVARAGRRWWELDVTYLVIKLFAALGWVWDIKQPQTDTLKKAA